jgi:hypothetical protein
MQPFSTMGPLEVDSVHQHHDEQLVVIDLTDHPDSFSLPCFDLDELRTTSASTCEANQSSDECSGACLHLVIGHPFGFAKRLSFVRDDRDIGHLTFGGITCYDHDAPVFFGNNGSLVLTIPLIHRYGYTEANICTKSQFLVGIHFDDEHFATRGNEKGEELQLGKPAAVCNNNMAYVIGRGNFDCIK